MALLTAIIPIGPKHQDANLISHWAASANKYSDELKIIIVEDVGTIGYLSEQKTTKDYGINNSIIIKGAFNSPGLSRNMGISKTESPWMCFWDADDLPDVDTFLEMVREADSNDFDLAIGGYKSFTVYEKLSTDQNTAEVDLTQVIKELGLWRMSFRRELIGVIRFESILMAEDQLFLLDLAFYQKNIYFYQKIVYLYQVQSPLQLTNSFSVNQIAIFVNLVNFRLRSKIYPTDKLSEYITARILVSGFAKLTIKNKFYLIKNVMGIISTNKLFGSKIILRTILIGFELSLSKVRDKIVRSDGNLR